MTLDRGLTRLSPTLCLALLASCHLVLKLDPGQDAATPGTDVTLADLGPLEASPLPGCGNGIAEGLEQCDGADLRGSTCQSLGFSGGTLACLVSCRLDGRACALPESQASLLHGGAVGLTARRLDLSQAGWGNAVAVPGLVGTPRWMQSRISALDGRDEAAAVVTETPAGLRLYLLHFGDAGWIVDQGLELGVAPLDADKRIFDLVRGAASGAALLVHSDGSASPVFRTYSRAAGWSAPEAVFAKPPGSAAVTWVTLAVKPGSDEATLLYADADTNVYTARWGGSAWVATVATAGQLDGPLGHTEQSFDAVHLGQSKRLLVTTATLYNMCCGWFLDAQPQPGGPCAPWSFQRLAARRGGDEAALVGEEASAVIFDGTSWKNEVTLWPSNVNYGSYGPRWADVAWVGAKPLALLVHRGWSDTEAPGGKGQLHWATATTSGAWSKGVPVPVAKMGELQRVQLAPLPKDDRVLAAFADERGSLWTASFDGAGWSAPQSLASGELPVGYSQPFSLEVWQSP